MKLGDHTRIVVDGEDGWVDNVIDRGVKPLGRRLHVVHGTHFDARASRKRSAQEEVLDVLPVGWRVVVVHGYVPSQGSVGRNAHARTTAALVVDAVKTGLLDALHRVARSSMNHPDFALNVVGLAELAVPAVATNVDNQLHTHHVLGDRTHPLDRHHELVVQQATGLDWNADQRLAQTLDVRRKPGRENRRERVGRNDEKVERKRCWPG